MKNHEAQALFKESELLYRERRYEEALQVLQQLDRRYPNTRNILYPIAKCLRRLARFEEAAAICDRLVLEFEDDRAKHMRGNLQKALERATAQTIAVASNVPVNLDDDLEQGFDALNLGDLPPLDEEAETVQIPGGYGANPPPPPRIQPTREIPWLYIGIGAVLAAVVLFGIIGAMSGSGGSDGGTAEIAAGEASGGIDETQLNINSYIYWAFATLITYCITLYITLAVSNKLPYADFSENALGVFGISLLCTVIGLVPCVGVFINIFILRKQYEFNFLNFLVLFGVAAVISIPFLVLYLLLFWGSFVELAEAQQAAGQGI